MILNVNVYIIIAASFLCYRIDFEWNFVHVKMPCTKPPKKWHRYVRVRLSRQITRLSKNNLFGNKANLVGYCQAADCATLSKLWFMNKKFSTHCRCAAQGLPTQLHKLRKTSFSQQRFLPSVARPIALARVHRTESLLPTPGVVQNACRTSHKGACSAHTSIFTDGFGERRRGASRSAPPPADNPWWRSVPSESFSASNPGITPTTSATFFGRNTGHNRHGNQAPASRGWIPRRRQTSRALGFTAGTHHGADKADVADIGR